MTKLGFPPIEEYLMLDYYKKILPYIKDKKVLDVGCAGHDLLDTRIYENTYRLWNHWFIYKTAKQTIGIDIEEKSIKAINDLGLSAKVMDAEQIKFDEKFDVVFAGELIEHLPNPGLFLKAAQKVLKPSGIIVLTTPNTFAVNKIIRVMQGMTNEPPENSDHTMYFTPLRLDTLAKKCGLKLLKIDYAFFPFTNQTLLMMLNRLACKFLGQKFKEQIIAIFQ